MKIKISSILVTILCIIAVMKVTIANQQNDVSLKSVTSESTENIESIDESGITWGLHEQVKNCVECHTIQKELITSEKDNLIEPVPELCYSCHKDISSQDKWWHGPAANGECLICHEPHRSNFKSLLKQSIPKLCYQCHEIETLQLIPNHADISYQYCLDCHENHTSSDRMLLKQNFFKTATGQAYMNSSPSNLPKSAFIDQRDSLAGLDGVKIELDVDGYEFLKRYGISEDLLRTKIEQCLKENGIKTLSSDEQAKRQSSLNVQFRLMEVPSQRIPGNAEALSGSFRLYLQQTVELLPVSNNSERKFCKAETWNTDAIFIWGVSQVEEGFSEAIDVLVGQFCKDYGRVNIINK